MFDFDATYNYRGIAAHALRFDQREVSVDPVLLCTDPSHYIHEEEECWSDYGSELIDDEDWVIVVWVGDDTEHAVEVSQLTKIDDESYCGACGQIGCGHG